MSDAEKMDFWEVCVTGDKGYVYVIERFAKKDKAEHFLSVYNSATQYCATDGTRFVRLQYIIL